MWISGEHKTYNYSIAPEDRHSRGRLDNLNTLLAKIKEDSFENETLISFLELAFEICQGIFEFSTLLFDSINRWIASVTSHTWIQPKTVAISIFEALNNISEQNYEAWHLNLNQKARLISQLLSKNTQNSYYVSLYNYCLYFADISKEWIYLYRNMLMMKTSLCQIFMYLNISLNSADFPTEISAKSRAELHLGITAYMTVAFPPARSTESMAEQGLLFLDVFSAIKSFLNLFFQSSTSDHAPEAASFTPYEDLALALASKKLPSQTMKINVQKLENIFQRLENLENDLVSLNKAIRSTADDDDCDYFSRKTSLFEEYTEIQKEFEGFEFSSVIVILDSFLLLHQQKDRLIGLLKILQRRFVRLDLTVSVYSLAVYWKDLIWKTSPLSFSSPELIFTRKFISTTHSLLESIAIQHSTYFGVEAESVDLNKALSGIFDQFLIYCLRFFEDWWIFFLLLKENPGQITLKELAFYLSLIESMVDFKKFEADGTEILRMQKCPKFAFGYDCLRWICGLFSSALEILEAKLDLKSHDLKDPAVCQLSSLNIRLSIMQRYLALISAHSRLLDLKEEVFFLYKRANRLVDSSYETETERVEKAEKFRICIENLESALSEFKQIHKSQYALRTKKPLNLIVEMSPEQKYISIYIYLGFVRRFLDEVSYFIGLTATSITELNQKNLILTSEGTAKVATTCQQQEA